MRTRHTVFVGVLLLALAACSRSHPTAAPAPHVRASTAAPSPSPSPSGEPRTYDGVKAAVDRQDKAIADRDGATVWDLLTSTGQAVMSRDDYSKVVVECSKIFTSEKTLSIAPNQTMTAATVTATDPAGGTFEWQMVYEQGRWKHQPSDVAMSWMKLGPHAIDVLKSEGAC
jgi:hypothetical protein